MGTSKALLPFGPECMLQRVVRLLSSVARPMIVVAAPDQVLPVFEIDVQLVRDRSPGRGPLEALAAGLGALDASCLGAYVTSCDVPLLVPALVRRLWDLLGECDIAVPRCHDHHHPLAAVYRRRVLAEVEVLLRNNRLRPFYLFERVPTRVVMEQELIDVDPRLDSLQNVNHRADYLAALATAGYSPTDEILAQFKTWPGPDLSPGRSEQE